VRLWTVCNAGNLTDSEDCARLEKRLILTFYFVIFSVSFACIGKKSRTLNKYQLIVVVYYLVDGFSILKKTLFSMSQDTSCTPLQHALSFWSHMELELGLTIFAVDFDQLSLGILNLDEMFSYLSLLRCHCESRSGFSSKCSKRKKRVNAVNVFLGEWLNYDVKFATSCMVRLCATVAYTSQQRYQ